MVSIDKQERFIFPECQYKESRECGKDETKKQSGSEITVQFVLLHVGYIAVIAWS